MATFVVMNDSHPLRAFRESREPPLSQHALANMLGVTKSTVSRWESGRRGISPEVAGKIQAITGIDARYVLGIAIPEEVA